jgi:hypothetical protein
MREIRTSGSMSGKVETEQGEAAKAPATERAGNCYASPTPPRHFPTLPFVRSFHSSRGSSFAVAVCVLGPGSLLSKLARISANTASFRRLDRGPNPRRIAARDVNHGLLAGRRCAGRSFSCSERSKGVEKAEGERRNGKLGQSRGHGVPERFFVRDRKIFFIQSNTCSAMLRFRKSPP